MPWIAFVWCMAHRLEWAIQEALKDAFFDTKLMTLLMIFYFVSKVSKKNQGIKGK